MSTTNLESDLNELARKLQSQIEDDTKELELRKKRIEKNAALLHAVRGSLNVQHGNGNRAGYGNQRKVVLAAVERIQKTRFTQDDVEAELRRIDPNADFDRARIRNAIWGLITRANRLKIVKKGTNTQPAEYEKVGGEPHAGNGAVHFKTAK